MYIYKESLYMKTYCVTSVMQHLGKSKALETLQKVRVLKARGMKGGRNKEVCIEDVIAVTLCDDTCH